MLYVSDLDGTLLDGDGRLSAASRGLLGPMLAQGLPFTVASARSVWSIRQMLEGLDIALPVIEFNGAFISDMGTGRHLMVNSLGEAVKHGIYLEIQAAGFLPFISTYDGQRDNLYHSHITNEGMRWYLDDRLKQQDPRLRPARPLEQVLDEQVICFTIIDRGENLKPLEERLGRLYGDLIKLHLFRHLYCEGWSWLTVHDARACKARALKALLGMLNVPVEALTVFGDDINDIEMFEQAGRAVAVANAIDAVKARAHKIIGSNREDSVARFIHDEWTPTRLNAKLHDAGASMTFRFTPFPTLTTDRLTLRRLTPDDGAALFALRSDEGNRKYLDRAPYQSMEKAQEYIRMINDGIDKDSWVQWAICRKGGDALIGTVCLWNIDREEQKAELGYEMMAEHQGRGYMREAVAAALGYGFGRMGLRAVEACTHPDNEPSLRLLRKFNFVRKGSVVLPEGHVYTLLHVLYREKQNSFR